MFVGTEEQARIRLERYTASSDDPALSSGEIDDLLADCKRADTYNLAPLDADWTPTWDLNYAAAEGWAIKRARAANDNQYINDSRGQSSSYLYLNCQREEERFRNKINASIPLAGRRDWAA